MLDISHLPNIDPRVLDTANEVASFAFNLEVSEADPFETVRVICPGSTMSEAPQDLVTCQIHAEFGGVALTVPRQLIDMISDRTLPGWRSEDPEKLYLSWRTVVCLEEVLKVLGMEDVNYSILGVHVPREKSNFANSITINIEIDSHLSVISATFGPIDAAKIPDSLINRNRNSLQLSAIEIPIQGKIVGRSITYAELDQLAVGDALLLNQDQNGNLTCEFDVAPKHTFAATSTPDGNCTIHGKDFYNAE